MKHRYGAKLKLIENHIQMLKWQLGQIIPQCRKETLSAYRQGKKRYLASSFNKSSGSYLKRLMIEILIGELERSVHASRFESALIAIPPRTRYRRAL
jgi:hypothetical protein